MPRNRMIKPDFFDDEKLAENVSRDARLTYIGMWVQSDDYGSVKGNPGWLKSQIFPYEEIKLVTFQKWINELISLKCLLPYSYNGEQFYFMPKFVIHQRIDKPSQQRNPIPPEDILRGLQEDSPNTPGGVDAELKLIELKEKLIEKKDDIPFEEIIKDLNQKAEKNYRHTGKATRDAIKARWSEGYRLADFQTVHTNKCRTWKGSPEFDQYLRPETLYRPSHFESYLNEKEIKTEADKFVEFLEAEG